MDPWHAEHCCMQYLVSPAYIHQTTPMYHRTNTESVYFILQYTLLVLAFWCSQFFPTQ